MTDRERLIKLMQSQFAELCRDGDWNFGEMIVGVADHLLANGVIVPPCKVGQTVYYISFGKIYKGKCHAITVHKNRLQIHLYDYDGDNAAYPANKVFTQRTEAEEALKERDEK